MYSLPDEFYDDEFGEDANEDNEDVQLGQGDGAFGAVQCYGTSYSNNIEESNV